MKGTYYQVMEYYEDEPDKKRLIYTFDNAMAAHDMIEFILNNDFCKPQIGVEEYEAPTKL